MFGEEGFIARSATTGEVCRLMSTAAEFTLLYEATFFDGVYMGRRVASLPERDGVARRAAEIQSGGEVQPLSTYSTCSTSMPSSSVKICISFTLTNTSAPLCSCSWQ